MTSFRLISCDGKIIYMIPQGQNMALVPQTGPSFCMRSEVVRCKPGQSAVVNMTNNVEASKIKETRIWLSSLSRSHTKTKNILSPNNVGVGRKRHPVIVAASPPTDDAVVATEPLTKEDLVGYLASGCKPKEKWRYNLIPSLYLD